MSTSSRSKFNMAELNAVRINRSVAGGVVGGSISFSVVKLIGYIRKHSLPFLFCITCLIFFWLFTVSNFFSFKIFFFLNL